jgi:hypothetical protein
MIGKSTLASPTISHARAANRASAVVRAAARKPLLQPINSRLVVARAVPGTARVNHQRKRVEHEVVVIST